MLASDFCSQTARYIDCCLSSVSQVEGIRGIMMAYTSALYNVSLAGPTLFGPVISEASLIASQSLGNKQQKYYVLLIITVSNTCFKTVL